MEEKTIQINYPIRAKGTSEINLFISLYRLSAALFPFSTHAQHDGLERSLKNMIIDSIP